MTTNHTNSESSSIYMPFSPTFAFIETAAKAYFSIWITSQTQIHPPEHEKVNKRRWADMLRNDCIKPAGYTVPWVQSCEHNVFFFVPWHMLKISTNPEICRHEFRLHVCRKKSIWRQQNPSYAIQNRTTRKVQLSSWHDLGPIIFRVFRFCMFLKSTSLHFHSKQRLGKHHLKINVT